MINWSSKFGRMENVEKSSNSPFEYFPLINEEDSYLKDEEDDRNQVTPQYIIDSLSHHTVRPNGVYLKTDCVCEICYNKYNIGDKVVCLPCQHNFHEYCIENWLKWVKSTCPVDKKTVIRLDYMKHAVTERQKLLLEAQALNKNNAASSSDKDIVVSSDDEKSILDDNMNRKTLEKKQRCDKIRRVEVSGECILKQLSPNGNKKQAKSITKFDESVESKSIPSPIVLQVQKNKMAGENDNLEKKEEKEFIGVFSKKYPQQIRDSVSAIRNSVQTKKSRFKNIEISKKFHTELDAAIVRMNASPEKSNNFYRNGISRSMSPPKQRESNKHASHQSIMTKRNVTFGDMLDLENEVNFCWIYKGNKQITLPVRHSRGHL